MRENVLREKSFAFAIRVVNLYRYLRETKNEYVISKQLLRSGTSIGANIREGEYAESKADFVHKLSIAQKEANETTYWLELLKATDYIIHEEFNSINNDIVELMKIITSSITTAKKINHYWH